MVCCAFIFRSFRGCRISLTLSSVMHQAWFYEPVGSPSEYTITHSTGLPRQFLLSYGSSPGFLAAWIYRGTTVAIFTSGLLNRKDSDCLNSSTATPPFHAESEPSSHYHSHGNALSIRQRSPSRDRSKSNNKKRS